MMAGSEEGDVGGYKGLEGETELYSHQDLVNGGTKFEWNGDKNGNVGDDLSGSYVFVGEVSGLNCDGKVKDGVELKGDGGVGNDQAFAVGVHKEVDLHGEFVGEVVESGEVENGIVDFEGTVKDQVESEPGNGLEIGGSEGTVKDRVDSEPGENLESRAGNGLEIGESEGVVIVSAVYGELLGKSVKDVEQNVVVSISEVGESEQSDTIGLGGAECGLGKVEAEIGEEDSQEQTELKSVGEDLESEIRMSVDCMSQEFEKDQNSFGQMKDLGSDTELGEIRLIKLKETGEIDKSVKAVEQDLIVPPADFGEGEQSRTVSLWADICELEEIQAGIEVDVGEGRPKEQTMSYSVEENLESKIRTTESVDCVSHDFEENQYKFKHMTDLDSEIDGGVQLGSEINAVADKGITCAFAGDDFKVGKNKDLDECIDGSQSVEKLDLTPSDAAILCSMDKVPIECCEDITAGTDDRAAVVYEASKTVVVQGTGTVNSTEHEASMDKVPIECCEDITAGTDDRAAVEHEASKTVVVQGTGTVSQEGLIILEDTGEIDKSVEAVEQDLIVSPADFGEGDKSHPVALWADICELEEIQAGIEVDVGGGEPKEQTELNSVEESLESKIRTKESVDCVSHDLEENQYKLKHMTDLDSEIDGGVQLGSEINAVADKGIICAAATDDFDVGKIKDLDECDDGSQSVKLDLTLSDTATLCSMDKVPIECCDDTTAGADDCAAVEHEASRSVVVQGSGTVNSTQLDSNLNKMYAESIGHLPAKVFGSAPASIDNDTVSDQGPVDADCRVGLVQGYETERVAHDTDGDGTLTTATRFVTDQSKISQINLGEQKSGCTKTLELNGNPDDAQDCIVPQVQSDQILRSDCNGATIFEPEVRDLVCPITDNKSESETELLDTEDVESRIFCVSDGTKSDTGVAIGLSNCAPNDVRSEMKIEFGTLDSAEVVTKSWGLNSLCKSQVLNGDIECNRKHAIFTTDSVESESCADMSFKPDVQNHSDMPDKDATLAECSIGDSVDGESLGDVAKGKSFQFLAKFPRIDDDKIQEQIRDAQVLVEDKTVLRDNIRCEINITRVNLQSVGDEFEATKSDERAARRLVKLKRQEIDSVEDKISRVKNSLSVMDITNRIAHMEHMIEHETHPLKEEKQMLHEISIMKKLRGQISSNVCSEEEVTQALSQIEPTEMQLKTLKKELGELKNKVSKAEAAVISLGKEYNDESKRLRELHARFRAANDIRQDAYKDLLGLKKQLHEKSKHYWIYKDDAKAASDYALNKDKEALYRLCAKQVDTFMDLWNKNDEFREDYVRCNMKSTLRRFKTLDGRSLAPDEEAHVFPVYVGEREVRQLYNPSRTTNLSSPTVLKQDNTVQPVETEQIDGKSLVVTEPKSKMLKIKTPVNPIPESGLHIGSGQLEAEEPKEEDKQQTREELELARKAEMLRKEEIAAKLKEQLREEEKAKALEALERKKRNADKAQKRAALRAQKEAEEKEKEREKRLRKKEKKSTDGENGLELQTNHIKDELMDSTMTKPSKTSHLNKYSKAKATIPPALRNRGKRRLKQLMWWIFGGLVVLFIFLVVNGGAFKNLRHRKGDSYFGNHFGNHPSAQPLWQS